MQKNNNLKLFLILSLIFSIITIINLYINERFKVFTYVIETLNAEEIDLAITSKTKEVKNFKDKFNEINLEKNSPIIVFDYKSLNHISESIFSNVVRFLQNNKNYRYLYNKKNNHSKKQKKQLDKITKNISIEGAYFLNPAFIDKVKLSFYSNTDEMNKEMLNYFDFIIASELNKIEKKI